MSSAEPDEGTPPIHVRIDEPYQSGVAPGWLRAVALAVLETERSDRPELTLAVTGDDTIRSLNRTYLGVDSTTDVLSFGSGAPGFVQAPDEPSYLGDVVLCYPQAKVQAEAAGHSVEAELALLVVHGVLHLLGYDHAQPDDKAVMWAAQEEILANLGLPGVRPSEGEG
jgi:probable rRNA maturation factor